MEQQWAAPQTLLILLLIRFVDFLAFTARPVITSSWAPSFGFSRNTNGLELAWRRCLLLSSALLSDARRRSCRGDRISLRNSYTTLFQILRVFAQRTGFTLTAVLH